MVRNLKIQKVYSSLILVLMTAMVFVISCSPPTPPGNNPPIILSVTPAKSIVQFGEEILISADVTDVDGDSLRFIWSPGLGNFTFSSKIDSAIWVAPDTSGAITIFLTVFDDFDAKDIDSTVIIVNNRLPIINSVTSSTKNVLVGSSVEFTVDATDPDGGPLTVKWTAEDGVFLTSITENTVTWRAPTIVGNPEVTATVTDNVGGSTSKSIIINVFQETGSVWVSDTFNDQIVKLSSDGTEIFRLSGFNKPNGIAVDLSDRSLWVADEFNNLVKKFDTSGNLIFEIPFNRPSDIVIQNNSNVWLVALNDTAQVYELSNSGDILRSLKGFYNPRSIDIHNLSGEVWVADTFKDRVIKIAPDVPDRYNVDSLGIVSLFHNEFSLLARGSIANFKKPEYLAINQSNGNVWIADTGNDRVVQIDNSDRSLFVVEGFNKPTGIDVNDSNGSVWVTNSLNNDVVKLLSQMIEILDTPDISAPHYNIQTKSGLHYSVTGGFIQPSSISVNSNNNIIWCTTDFGVLKILDNGTTNVDLIGIFTGFDAPRGIFVFPGIGK